MRWGRRLLFTPHLPRNDFAKSLRALLPLVHAKHGFAMTGEEKTCTNRPLHLDRPHPCLARPASCMEPVSITRLTAAAQGRADHGHDDGFTP
jgi:hypothetical protein